MFAKTNSSFRNTMMIRLIKIIKKYRIHFNEHPNLYNNIINYFGKWYGKVEDNTNINAIKNNTIKKSKRNSRKK